MIKNLEQELKRLFGIELLRPANQEILNEGDLSCKHSHVFYINNALDEQAWWCDDCTRHERTDYSPGFIMKFPKDALIRTPNPQYGGENFYALKANDDGEAKLLPECIKRGDSTTS